MTRDARLLQVDEAQRVLLSVREDGTYAQMLPLGLPARIADVTVGADFSADGRTVVLWSAPVDDERTVWLWRPGTTEAAVVSQKARGAVLHDASQSYVAFLERDGAGTTFVRVAGTASCMPGDCVLQTPLQVQGGTPVLERGGRLLSLVDGTHRWFIDTSAGAVTDLGVLPGPSFLSPGGTRYGWVEGDLVRLVDIATGAQVWDWDQVWRKDSTAPGWTATHAFMLNEERVYVGSKGIPAGAPQGWPEEHALTACGVAGCLQSDSRARCVATTFGGQPAMWCVSDPCIAIRCETPGPDYRDSEGHSFFSRSQEKDTLVGPVFSPDLTEVARVKGTKGGLHWLEWTRGSVVSKLNLDAPYPTAPLLFLPDQKRVVFHQPVLRDGVAESHLWTWDQSKRVDLGLLDGTPGPGSLVRANPATLYLDTDVVNADGTPGTAIVRVDL
ncbi:hypothetical protein JYK02_09440 [Corallococcus macrosporus]|uniref:WD40 repeat domain-containing protein n=1 Tax=Corallococcus macrosporus TaxID=35 RepID=A0ABS3D9S0_9BACT|nr:hypothetical protein [Corallococcus macrosporus]MBN8227731.1 hypothetical protein [Corallococcus macrosporus]